MTNMNIVCYSLCMDFGLRQNARRTEKSNEQKQRLENGNVLSSQAVGLLFFCVPGAGAGQQVC